MSADGTPRAVVELTAVELDELGRLVMAALRVARPTGDHRSMLDSLRINFRAARATLR